MKKFAVIDIGSNSVRLMFVADGKVLYKTLQTTRLGQGLATSKQLQADAIERSATAVAEFVAQAKTDGAERTVAFATAAVRSATNGQTFVDRVFALCGLNVEVIAGETEAELGILGALGNDDGFVVDVGGASTEIVGRVRGEMVYKKSVDVGVVRLKDVCGRDRIALQQYAKAAVKAYGTIPIVGKTYAIGGTATTLAALVLGLTEYSSERVTGTVLTVETMQTMADKLLEMTVEEIAELPCMPSGRADVLAGGAVWLAVLMQELGISEITVSDRDNLEGYAIRRGWMESV
ncbi:MAG: hypothetical protein IKA88_05280 [Clostridia bacterium]|nr:hypothetical protein [Clostridia bacterium]